MTSPEGSRAAQCEPTLLQEQQRDLEILRRAVQARRLELVYVTGRHYESVLQVMKAKNLPEPSWILCDVGTSIYVRITPAVYHANEDYVNHLDARTGGLTAQELQAMLTPQADCRLQEAEKQRRHKLSFYCPGPRMQANQDDLQSRLDRLQLPYQVLGSLDPFNGQGLLDVLPAGVNKASGLRWWAAQQQRPLRTIAYAGDSGNDFAALTDDFLAIVVANADRDLIQRIEQHHLQRGTRPQLYLAQRNATGGVVDGCRWFGLLESTSPQGTSP